MEGMLLSLMWEFRSQIGEGKSCRSGLTAHQTSVNYSRNEKKTGAFRGRSQFEIRDEDKGFSDPEKSPEACQ